MELIFQLTDWLSRQLTSRMFICNVISLNLNELANGKINRRYRACP
jgi:hypothetical protein